jgi:hypothetical protein
MTCGGAKTAVLNIVLHGHKRNTGTFQAWWDATLILKGGAQECEESFVIPFL